MCLSLTFIAYIEHLKTIRGDIMAFVSLKDLAKSPLTVELFVNLSNQLCVRLSDEDGVYRYPVVENVVGNLGVNLDYPID